MLSLGQGSLYKQVYADDILTEAWRRVRTGTDRAGVDGVTVAHFQARLLANLKALQATLHQRRYQPQPVKRITIPKSDGTRRPLGILAVMGEIGQRVDAAETLEQAMGHEGAASAAYFRLLRTFLRFALGFHQRRAPPPTDPVNALLSLGYTLLYNHLYAAINVVGLDPYQGFLHQL